jgi:hypothetical protein
MWTSLRRGAGGVAAAGMRMVHSISSKKRRVSVNRPFWRYGVVGGYPQVRVGRVR